MLYFKKNYATVWSVEDHEIYAVVKLSTSRKDKRDDTYKNTNWSFVRFVGNAYSKELVNLPEKTRITIDGGISQESYVNDAGERAWPKNPQVVVFHWDFPEEKSNVDRMDTPPLVSSDDEDESPF
jgi:hypothetical protein